MFTYLHPQTWQRRVRRYEWRASAKPIKSPMSPTTFYVTQTILHGTPNPLVFLFRKTRNMPDRSLPEALRLLNAPDPFRDHFDAMMILEDADCRPGPLPPGILGVSTAPCTSACNGISAYMQWRVLHVKESVKWGEVIPFFCSSL